MSLNLEVSENMNDDNFISEYDELVEKIVEIRKKQGFMDVGGTHFKGERRKYKQSDYTLKKSKKEFLDNIIYMCKNIKINVVVEDGILNRMIISDDYEKGFENINRKGVDNPFNMTHIRPGQDCDSQTSQFGIGMKAGAISTCNKFIVYTRVGDDYWNVIMDFIKMENVKEARFSFDPAKFKITKEQYRHYHPFDYGSTLIFEDIHKNMYETTNIISLCRDLIKSTSECYSKIIYYSNISITVNDEIVTPEKNYFLEPQCAPFNTMIKLYKLQKKTEINVKDTNEKKLIVSEQFIIRERDDDNEVYHLFNKETRKLNKLTENECIKFGLINKMKPKVKKENWIFVNSISDLENACLICEGTFMMYHPDLNVLNNKELNQSRYPKGRARLFREGRCYGDWDIDATNGSSNFTDIEVTFVSKEIANTLGLTWNKNISNEQRNDLCIVVKMMINKIRTKLNGDTSSSSNYKLYELAIKNNIYIPEIRKPTKIKKPEQEPNPITRPALEKPKPITQPPVENPKPVTQPPVENPKPITQPPVEKPELNPKEAVLGACKHVTISRKEGKKIIEFMRDHKDSNLFIKEIKEIIKDYLKSFDRKQLDIMFKYISNGKECYDLLIEIIDQYYDYVINDEGILCGSKMKELFKNYL
jgi:hypothetical protein